MITINEIKELLNSTETYRVGRYELPEGDLLVTEVQPSFFTSVRYCGRIFFRIGPRRDLTPCLHATIDDLDVDKIIAYYFPKAFSTDLVRTDKRELKEQLAAIHLYDRSHDCPTHAAIVLFGKNPKYLLPGGAYLNGQKDVQMNDQKELTERQASILSFIQNSDNVNDDIDVQLNIRNIALKYHVSDKTVYRDLSKLKQLGLIERQVAGKMVAG